MQLEDPVRQGMQFYYMGDHTWATMLGQSVKLQPVPIQSLSELERARLREVALYHLEDRNPELQIALPRETHKRRKSLRRKLDSFSKEKKEREMAPKAFGLPLSRVIANDRAHKQRQDALKESRRDCLDLEASILCFQAEKRQQHQGNKSLRSTVSPLELHPPTFLATTSRAHRRGALSVDCISDLVESQSRLLEALQLSHPNELEARKVTGRSQTKLSLNPICRQVPRVVEHCCRHLETYGLQTVGIFRVGSSKKRVRQLREDFDLGNDVVLDEDLSVHDVAALLKEFLRDMPDPLLPRELYSAFLHATLLKEADQLPYLQELVYLLPPCNCDTLLHLLGLLHTVHSHAEDRLGPDHQEIPGNKMTAINLAVIFGPNLLQREPCVERDPCSQTTGIEDSAAIIAVTLLLIQNYKRLFMVSAELQQEVLMSLIQTDPDIIDYLLRRKLSSCRTLVETGIDGRRDEMSGGGASTLEPLSPLFPELQDDSSLSSEVFLSMLCLSSRKCSSEDDPIKPIGQLRQYHSHNNLVSLSQAPPWARNKDREVLPHSHLSRDPSPKGHSVWVKQDPPISTGEGKPPPTNFWDFFTRPVSGSETVV